MTFKAAAVEVLRGEKRPMKAEDITDLALRRKLLVTEGKTPSATMGAQLYTDVKNNGTKSEFVQLGFFPSCTNSDLAPLFFTSV